MAGPIQALLQQEARARQSQLRRDSLSFVPPAADAWSGCPGSRARSTSGSAAGCRASGIEIKQADKRADKQTASGIASKTTKASEIRRSMTSTPTERVRHAADTARSARADAPSPQVDQQWTSFHRRSTSFLEDRSALLENLRAVKAEEQMQACTFMPNVSVRSDTSEVSRPGLDMRISASSSSLYERSRQREQRRTEKITLRRQELFDQEMAHCSFRPALAPPAPVRGRPSVGTARGSVTGYGSSAQAVAGTVTPISNGVSARHRAAVDSAAPRWPGQPQDAFSVPIVGSKQRSQIEFGACTSDDAEALDRAIDGVTALSGSSVCDNDDAASFGSPGGGWAGSIGAPTIDGGVLAPGRSHSEELKVLQRQRDRRQLVRDTLLDNRGIPSQGVALARSFDQPLLGTAAAAQTAQDFAAPWSEEEIAERRQLLRETLIGVSGSGEGFSCAPHGFSGTSSAPLAAQPLSSQPPVAHMPTRGAPAAVANAVSRMEGLLLGDERESEPGEGWPGGWPDEEETW